MNIHTAIEQSGKWLEFCDALLSKHSTKATTRIRVAAALLHLAIEHNISIQLLVKKHLYGSGFTLLRPQFESYIRGVWFLRYASEKQIEKFIKSDELPRISELIDNIQNVAGYKEGTLKLVKERTWNNLCGYTHGGYVQVAYRNTQNEISNDYQEEHIVGLLSSASAVTLLSMVAFSWLFESEAMANEVFVKHNEIFKA